MKQPVTKRSPGCSLLFSDFREFLLGEVRYSSLLKQYPETAEALFAKTEQDAKERLNNYKRLAGKA